MLKLEVAALQSQGEMPEEAAPTILPAGEPCFLPLDAGQREQFFRTAQFKKKAPELAQHGNDVVVSESDFIPRTRG